MTEWLTYSPSDLLLFSPRVYYRLIELHNRALWPAQIGTIALGLVVLFALWRKSSHASRVIGGILGLLWIWVGWSFLWERYATINWPSAYVAPVFAVEGVLLIWLGAVRNRLELDGGRSLSAWGVIALTASAILAYPLVGPIMGRTWGAAEVFGIAPDPTAVATLGLLALVRGRGIALMLVPALWCALSSGILHLLDSGDFFVPGTAAFAAILLRLLRGIDREVSV